MSNLRAGPASLTGQRMVDGMMKSAVLLTTFFLGACAHAQTSYPKDIDGYVKNADSCRYLSGE
ncbi:hypothetical protein GIX45_21150 [Erwinia sp. CPCC 100877]|nr:hypothetical protein [Erwinia sp. CPCC 100877]